MRHYSDLNIADAKWLDIGCGNGEIAAVIAPRVKEIIGIDPEPWPIWIVWEDKHPNLKLIQGSYAAIPQLLGENSIDIIICNQVYEHVPEPVCLIESIFRALKPGGYCYFAGPNLLFPIEPHVYWPFIHWLPRRTAISLMKLLGSRYLIDANALDYWRLKKQLLPFQIQNGLPWILKHPKRFLRNSVLWEIIGRVPQWLIQVLTPVTPGFVFILRKPILGSGFTKYK